MEEPMRNSLSRRTFAGAVFTLAIAPALLQRAAAAPAMIVHKDPSCGCCEGWVAHIRSAGVAASVVNEPDMGSVKARLRVPEALASCHTAEIDGYVIEGHVPAVAVMRLLRERPAAFGLAAPGMPDGSPGMETGAPAETFEVYLFGAEGARLFGRFRGSEAV
jgi:hypothetical protein